MLTASTYLLVCVFSWNRNVQRIWNGIDNIDHKVGRLYFFNDFVRFRFLSFWIKCLRQVLYLRIFFVKSQRSVWWKRISKSSNSLELSYESAAESAAVSTILMTKKSGFFFNDFGCFRFLSFLIKSVRRKLTRVFFFVKSQCSVWRKRIWKSSNSLELSYE